MRSILEVLNGKVFLKKRGIFGGIMEYWEFGKGGYGRSVLVAAPGWIRIPWRLSGSGRAGIPAGTWVGPFLTISMEEPGPGAAFHREYPSGISIGNVG